MTFGSRKAIAAAASTAALWIAAVTFVAAQAPKPAAPAPKPAAAAPAPNPAAGAPNQLMADQVFKNVTVLKGIPVDEFMGTMGVFSASLGISCEDCHTASSNDWANYARDTSPRKMMARQMTVMMTTINKQFFGGRQVVTCYSCHRGSLRPRVTPSLVQLYASVQPDELDVLLPPAPPGTPTPAQILEKYNKAVGPGAAKVTSITAKGSYTGYGPEGFPRPFELYAKAPNQKALIVRDKEAGDAVTVFNGTAAWVSAPFRPVPVLELHGQELDSARADAEFIFPANVTVKGLTNLRSSIDFINDRSVLAIQGNKGGALVTMYFDEETGLMTRLVRSTGSPVGRLPVQSDFSDFREVNGVKVPFKWTTTWLDGRANYEATEVQVNQAIDNARFARPAPAKPY
jgi:photosynthetic reaction center cytochrome c subunit